MRKRAQQVSALVITSRCAGTGDSRPSANMESEEIVVWSEVVKKSRSLRAIVFVTISRCADTGD